MIVNIIIIIYWYWYKFVFISSVSNSNYIRQAHIFINPQLELQLGLEEIFWNISCLTDITPHSSPPRLSSLPSSPTPPAPSSTSPSRWSTSSSSRSSPHSSSERSCRSQQSCSPLGKGHSGNISIISRFCSHIFIYLLQAISK